MKSLILAFVLCLFTQVKIILDEKNYNNKDIVSVIIQESSLAINTAIAMKCDDLDDGYFSHLHGTKFLLEDELKIDELINIISKSHPSYFDESYIDVRAKIYIQYQIGQSDTLCISASVKYYILNGIKMEFEDSISGLRIRDFIWGDILKNE